MWSAFAKFHFYCEEKRYGRSSHLSPWWQMQQKTDL